MTIDSATPMSERIDFGRFFELAVDVMVATRPDGRFEVVNRAFAELLGVPRERLISSPWTDFVHPDDRLASVEESTKEFVVEDHRTMTFENRYIDVHGVVHWLNWNAELDPETGLVYGTARDVSEERAARETLEAAYRSAEQARAAAEAANHAKSDFLSRMSHELRTPMNSILGFGQLLELDELTVDQHDSVEQILRAGRHLLSLIDEVLDIARIESGRDAISVEPVRVADTMADALSLLGPLAKARGITMQSSHAQDPEVHISADRRRLHQVLVNFLSNAIKYTPSGSTAQLATAHIDDGWLRISVIDDGPGIAEDLLSRLFQPFERIGAELTGTEGTGLGLAHSRALADRMGGRVGVDSEVGRGSAFWIELPTCEPAGESFDDHPLPAVQDSSVHGTLLYIEDNPANTRLLERVLDHRPNLFLSSAMLGRRGIEMAREQHPDLIALDLHLPDISGETVLHELQTDPRTRSIPVVILSADATRRQVDRLLSAGAAAYLTKPLDIAQLLTVIDHHVGTRRAPEGNDSR